MEINNDKELEEAETKLEKLIDYHKYNQMLAGDSKLPIDPEILWITKAIKKYKDEKETKQFNYSGYYGGSD